MDGATRRWLLFSGPTIVGTLAADNPFLRAIKSQARGSDQRGNVWGLSSSRPAIDEQHVKSGTTTLGPADSDYVVRANRGTGKIDTLIQVRLAVSQQTLMANAKGELTSVNIIRPPLSVSEEAAMFLDGWVAVARLGPYRVDWISPNGRMTLGRPLPFTPIKSTKAEKAAFFERQRRRQFPAGAGVPPRLHRRCRPCWRRCGSSFPTNSRPSPTA